MIDLQINCFLATIQARLKLEVLKNLEENKMNTKNKIARNQLKIGDNKNKLW